MVGAVLRHMHCANCYVAEEGKGTGVWAKDNGDGTQPCTYCDEKGHRTMIRRSTGKCPECKGSGIRLNKFKRQCPCYRCNGTGDDIEPSSKIGRTVALKNLELPMVTGESLVLQPKRKSMARVKKAVGTAVVSFVDRMKEFAQKQKQAERNSVGGMKSISTRGGHLSLNDKNIPGNELQLIVLGSVFENQYFTSSFDPDTPQSPACYAFGKVDELGEGMVPHDESAEKQNPDCPSCRWNVMGSAEKGRGKACKNVRRLAVMLADDFTDTDTIKAAEVFMLKVPVTSVGNWAKYATELADELERPKFTVVTKLAPVPDKKSQFKLTFEHVADLDFTEETWEAILAKREDAAGILTRPYPKFEADEEEEAAPKKFTRPAAKKPSRRAAA